MNNISMIVSDVDVEKPDEKSLMTYVATILKAYPEAGEANVSSCLLVMPY